MQIPATATGLVIQNKQASTSRSILRNLLIEGELIYQYASRSVLRVSPDTVVKINKSEGTTEIHVLDHIHQHSQQIPVPLPLGMIRIGSWSYIFTSFVPGIRLDRIWANLTVDKKRHIQDQLNRFFTELRRLPGPSMEGHFGAGKPPVCKGGHRYGKLSSLPIVSEAQFNAFLLDDSVLEPAQLDYFQTSLRSDHQIVMTHGDLCPLNLLVHSEDTLHISGIVDWETGGAYPEYWEYINAFKSFRDQNDWCLYLPEAAIGRHLEDYAMYSLIGRFARG